MVETLPNLAPTTVVTWGDVPTAVFVEVAFFAEYPVLVGMAFDPEQSLFNQNDAPVCRLAPCSPEDTGVTLAAWRRKWPNTVFTQHTGSQGTSRNLANSLVQVWLSGTSFQCAVWRIILSIPYGNTITYGDIASQLGLPSAARAVGMACGANPVPLIVPCHRVVSSGGGIGGYSGRGGIPLKQQLLQREANSSLF